MKLQLVKGASSQTVQLFIQDSSSTTGAGLTGLVFNSAGLTAYYARPRATAVQITLVTQTVTGGFSSGGFVEIDATNMPGWYRLDLPDAALLTGVDFVSVHLKGATNMAPLPLEIQLTSVNLNDSVRAGMTALPNAAAEAAGGLYTRGTGAGQINQDANGRIDSRTAAMAANVVTATAIEADAITAAKIATNAIGADEFAQGAADKVWSSAARTLTAFSTALAVSVWDVLETAILTASSIGLKVKNNLDAVLSNVETDTQDIQSRLPAALVGGRMDSDIGAKTGNVALSAQEKLDVNAEADAALVDIHLDHLLAVVTTSFPGNAGSILGEMLERITTWRYVTEAVSQAPGGAGGTDWTATERQHIRHRLGIDGSAAAPSATPSLARPGDEMDLLAATEDGLVDKTWDENIVSAHGTADTSGLLLRALGALISQRTNTPTLHGLLDIPDSADANLNQMAGRVWEEILTGATHNTNTSAGKRLRQLTQVAFSFDGTIDSATATTVVLTAPASATNDFYFPGLAVVTSSFGVQFRRIESYAGGTRTLTVATPWTTNPIGGDAITVIPWASVRVSDIDANVIDAGAIATDAIGSAEFAQAAADKIWSSATRTLTALGFTLGAGDLAADTIGASQLATDAVNEIRDAIKALVIESQGSITLQQALSIVLSALAGVTADSGATLKTPDGVATRIAATINTSQERTAMTLTPSS